MLSCVYFNIKALKTLLFTLKEAEKYSFNQDEVLEVNAKYNMKIESKNLWEESLNY